VGLSAAAGSSADEPIRAIDSVGGVWGEGGNAVTGSVDAPLSLSGDLYRDKSQITSK